MRKKILSLVLVTLLLTSGCSSLKSRVELGMDLEEGTKNLDPQFATDKTAHLVLLNIFEGLVVKDSQGKLHPGAAESWTISPDGKTYTFYLRKEGQWPAYGENKTVTPIKGEDFVFAFQRLFDPAYPSPYGSRYQSIVGGEGIMKGELEATALGVNSPNEHTVEFQLTQADELFLELLSRPAALPCEAEFFYSTRGRYGTKIEYVLGNGPFSLSFWEEDNRLSFVKNSKYKGESKVEVDTAHLFTQRSGWEERFQNGTTHILKVSGDQLAPYNEGYKIVDIEELLWALLFRGDTKPWGIPYFRNSLISTYDPQNLALSLPPSAAISTGFISPRGYSIADVEQGKSELAKGLTVMGVEKLETQPLYIPESQASLVAGLISQWEKGLGIQFKLEYQPVLELEERGKKGDFGLMLYPLPITEPLDSLQWFTTGHEGNFFGYKNHVYDKLVEDINKETTIVGYEGKSRQAEGILLNEGVLLPLYIEKKYYVLDKKAEQVDIYPNSLGVRFHKATTAA